MSGEIPLNPKEFLTSRDLEKAVIHQEAAEIVADHGQEELDRDRQEFDEMGKIGTAEEDLEAGQTKKAA